MAVAGMNHAARRARDPDGIEFEVRWLVPPDRWGSGEHEAVVRPVDLDAERRRFADPEVG